MDAVPETKYVRADDGTYIAYQIMGDGPIDLLVCFGWALSIEDQIDWAQSSTLGGVEPPGASHTFHFMFTQVLELDS